MCKIKPPTIEYMTEEIFKHYVTFTENSVLLLNCLPKEIAIFFRSIMPEEIIVSYAMEDAICECGGKTHIHSYQNCEIDKKHDIKKYRYKCMECGKTFNTSLDYIVEKGCSYSNDIKDFVADIYSKGHKTYEEVANLINDTHDTNISKTSVYNYNQKYTDKKIEQKESIIKLWLKIKNIVPTGFPGHDEAFLRIMGIKYAYLVMLDSNNGMIMNDMLCLENQYRDLLEPFITYSQKDLSVYSDPTRPNPASPLLLPDFYRHTLIGDGLKEYPQIAKKNNMDFHYCIFHVIMNQRTPSWKEQRQMKRKILSNNLKIEQNQKVISDYYTEYNGKRGRIGENDTKRRKKYNKMRNKESENKKLNKKNSKLNKKIKEYEDLDERCSEIFAQDTVKNAQRRINILNNQIEFLPEPHARFIRRISKNPDPYLSHIENPLIPKTNNLLELFFNIVFPKKYRNIFKTDAGVKRFLRSGKIRWYENIVFNEKIKIERINAWINLERIAKNMMIS